MRPYAAVTFLCSCAATKKLNKFNYLSLNHDSLFIISVFLALSRGCRASGPRIRPFFCAGFRAQASRPLLLSVLISRAGYNPGKKASGLEGRPRIRPPGLRAQDPASGPPGPGSGLRASGPRIRPPGLRAGPGLRASGPRIRPPASRAGPGLRASGPRIRPPASRAGLRAQDPASGLEGRPRIGPRIYGPVFSHIEKTPIILRKSEKRSKMRYLDLFFSHFDNFLGLP